MGSQYNHYILADAPTFNTVKDFWNMIWSQGSTYIVCVTALDESSILLYPKQLNTDQTFGDFTVNNLTMKHQLYVVEREVRVTSSEANLSRTVVILQPKQWSTKK